jgi:hypothetical protein
MTTTDALQRAIQYLGAVEVAPGRYAYRNERLSRWEIISQAAMCARDRGGHWCPRHQWAVAMPAWWTPDERFAAYIGDEIVSRDMTRDRTVLKAHWALQDGQPTSVVRVVTAELTTGEEVPC